MAKRFEFRLQTVPPPAEERQEPAAGTELVKSFLECNFALRVSAAGDLLYSSVDAANLGLVGLGG